MRLIYFGSGEFGLPTLSFLHDHHEVIAVATQPDRPAGRHRRPKPTPIGKWAEDHHLAVYKVDDVNSPPFIQQSQAMEPDAAVVIAFGQKLSESLIDSLGRLAVNLHASLLPAYRGAAPINWAVINNDRITGVTVISLAQRMDAGCIYARAELEINPMETAGELHDRLARLGPEVISQVLNDLASNKLQPVDQDDAIATRAPKLTKSDGTVRFDLGAEQVRARIHGLSPWPGCRVIWHANSTGNSTELILRRAAAVTDLSCFIGLERVGHPGPGEVMDDKLHVATSDGAVRIIELQLPGGRPMSAEDFLRGHPLKTGDILRPSM